MHISYNSNYQSFIFRIKSETFLYWVDEILAVFKHERPGTHYTPYKERPVVTLATGKLYDKYCQVRKKIRATPSADDTIVLSRTQEDYIKELKSTSLHDVEKIKELWKQTHEGRMQLLTSKDYSIPQYYAEFPVLKSCFGSSLVTFYTNLILSLFTQIPKTFINIRMCRVH